MSISGFRARCKHILRRGKKCGVATIREVAAQPYPVSRSGGAAKLFPEDMFREHWPEIEQAAEYTVQKRNPRKNPNQRILFVMDCPRPSLYEGNKGAVENGS